MFLSPLQVKGENWIGQSVITTSREKNKKRKKDTQEIGLVREKGDSEKGKVTTNKRRYDIADHGQKQLVPTKEYSGNLRKEKEKRGSKRARVRRRTLGRGRKV